MPNAAGGQEAGPFEVPTRVGDTIVVTVHRAEHLLRITSLTSMFEEASPYIVASLEAEGEEPMALQTEPARCGGSNPRWKSAADAGLLSGASDSEINQLSFEILPKTKRIKVGTSQLLCNPSA